MTDEDYDKIIDELEAKLSESEALLAKAVEFLDKLRNEQCYDGFELVELLRELTGGKDE